MARFMTSTQFLLGTLAALAVSLASLSAHAAWEVPNTPTDNMNVPAPGVTATVSNAYFRITQEDVGKAVAEQLKLQAVEQNAEVFLTTGTPGILYSADHPLKVAIHSLQIDATAKRWQAQAYILGNGQTEIVKPVSGTYLSMIEVPIVTRQLGHSDVIEAKDLSTKSFPERQLRKDTVTDPKQLIGQSPRTMITPDRPIRTTEISSPVLIKKGEPVQMIYSNPYMSLKATGTALQDGARGDLIRVKNDKSEKAVSGRVTGSGTVEVNTTETTIAPTAAPAPIPAAPAPTPAEPPATLPAPVSHAAPQPIPATSPFKPGQQ